MPVFFFFWGAPTFPDLIHRPSLNPTPDLGGRLPHFHMTSFTFYQMRNVCRGVSPNQFLPGSDHPTLGLLFFYPPLVFVWRVLFQPPTSILFIYHLACYFPTFHQDPRFSPQFRQLVGSSYRVLKDCPGRVCGIALVSGELFSRPTSDMFPLVTL